jgi:hypothetical protein
MNILLKDERRMQFLENRLGNGTDNPGSLKNFYMLPNSLSSAVKAEGTSTILSTINNNYNKSYNQEAKSSIPVVNMTSFEMREQQNELSFAMKSPQTPVTKNINSDTKQTSQFSSNTESTFVDSVLNKSPSSAVNLSSCIEDQDQFEKLDKNIIIESSSNDSKTNSQSNPGSISSVQSGSTSEKAPLAASKVEDAKKPAKTSAGTANLIAEDNSPKRRKKSSDAAAASVATSEAPEANADNGSRGAGGTKRTIQSYFTATATAHSDAAHNPPSSSTTASLFSSSTAASLTASAPPAVAVIGDDVATKKEPKGGNKGSATSSKNSNQTSALFQQNVSITDLKKQLDAAKTAKEQTDNKVIATFVFYSLFFLLL